MRATCSPVVSTVSVQNDAYGRAFPVLELVIDIAIFALTRNPAKADALVVLQEKYANKLFVVSYDGEDPESVQKAAKEVESVLSAKSVVANDRIVFARTGETRARTQIHTPPPPRVVLICIL